MRTAIRTGCTIAVLMLAYGTARADVVLEWNGIMLTTAGALNPFAQARVAAITQLAVFEAVNACTDRYTPYLKDVTAPDGASPEAAAIAAAHGVLQHFFPANTAALDAARTASLSAVTNGPGKSNGIAVGESAAAAMIARRVADGSSPAETFVPDAGEPGVWQPTPPQFGPGILLHWRNLVPFAIKSSDQFRSVPPPSLRSRRYARDYNEVMRVGSSASTEREQDRADVARYFAVVSAVHAWNSALQQVASDSRRSISKNARAFALLNMAISDALVSSMETKYFYQLWRPVTAIAAGSEDGNPRTDPDPGWLPLIPTPAFPSYPSAHASASHAARYVLERVIGLRHASFTLTHLGVPGVVLPYSSFEDLTDDVDDARVFGGIHFRFDQDAGAWQGRQVGAFVVSRYLQPVRKHQPQ